jgi:small subunit ribosomal protein S9
MNVLQRAPRQLASAAGRRALQTQAPFVPPAARQYIERGPRIPAKAKPDTSTFYSGRPEYQDAIANLEAANHYAAKTLRSLSLLPLPAFAKAALPPRQPVWKDREDMAGVLGGNMTQSRYRRAINHLNTLDEYRIIAKTAHAGELYQSLESILDMFEKDNKKQLLARGRRKPVKLDEHGRSYTLGRRKTSSARVWMIPVKAPAPEAQEAAPERLPGIFDYGNAAPMEATPEQLAPPLQATTVLVNNVPLATYFPLPADREKIVRPFKLAGVLGQFNVFALVRGGGTTGQSGAIMTAIAKGIVAHTKDHTIEVILRRCKANLLTMISGMANNSVPQRNCFVVILVWLNVRRQASRRPARRYVSNLNIS